METEIAIIKIIQLVVVIIQLIVVIIQVILLSSIEKQLKNEMKNEVKITKGANKCIIVKDKKNLIITD